MDQSQAKFEGWALIELYGHGSEAGYVTTQYFGTACMFQVDVPELPARQETLKAPRYVSMRFCPEGTVVEREAIPGRSRLLGPGSIYAMNHATKEAVLEAISRSERREIKVLSIPEGSTAQVLLPGESGSTEEFNEDDDEEAEGEPEF